MKLLLTMNVPYTRAHGGANRSNRAVCEALAQQGHGVTAVVPALATPSSITLEQMRVELAAENLKIDHRAGVDVFESKGVEVHAVIDASQMRSYLQSQIDVQRPDSVLVSSEDPSQSLLDASLKRCPERVVYLGHTPPLFPFGPCSLYPGEARTNLVRRAAAVVVISQFCAEYIERWAGIRSEVIHFPHYGSGPFPELGHYENPYVLLLNASEIKGLPIFLQLATALPQIQFAAVPGYGTTGENRALLASFPNITCLPNRKNLDELLGQARVLLMPSLWVEGFGMAAVDAMARGIPVLASRFGGLIEAKLGTDYLLPVQPITEFEKQTAGNLLPVPVVPKQDATPWVKALKELCGDPKLYRAQSKESSAAAKAFIESLSIDPLLDLLVRVTKSGPRHFAGAAIRTEPEKSNLLDALLNDPRRCAQLVERLKGARSAQSAAPVISRYSRKEPIALSFAQERLWFLDQLSPEGVSHLMPVRLHLRGNLNERVLLNGLETILERHEVLRTCFTDLDGLPVQTILPRVNLPFKRWDLTTLSRTDAEKKIQELARHDAAVPFDLAKAPLLRVMLVRLGPDEHMLFFTMHHIVSDGWSLAVLVREFASLYDAFSRSEPNPLAALLIQYADYSQWQRAQMQGKARDNLLSYWKTRLQGMPAALKLPTDFLRPEQQSSRGGRVRKTISPAVAEAARQMAVEEKATLFMVLLAGFKALLSRYAGQTDIVVGSHVANRELKQTQDLIGFFINHLVLRTDLSGNPSYRDLLRRVRETAVGAYAHQDLPLEVLMSATRPERTLRHTPMFQVMFVVQNTPQPKLSVDGLQITALADERQTANLDWYLAIEEAEGTLTATMEYRTDLFEEATVRDVLAWYEELMRQLLSSPQTQLNDLLLPDSLRKEERVDDSIAATTHIALASSFSVGLARETLEFWMDYLHLPCSVRECPHDQVFQLLLDPESALNQPAVGVNIVLIRFEDWQRSRPFDPVDARRHAEDLCAAILSSRSRTARPLLLGIAPRSPELEDKGALDEIEQWLAGQLNQVAGVRVIDEKEWFRYYQCTNFYDRHTDELGRMPYGEEGFAVIGSVLARKIHAHLSMPPKVVVVDCDGTLWDGVCGEDGPDSLVVQQKHLCLQHFLLREGKRGRLLCLCSKNDSADVDAVFEKRTDLVVRRSDFVDASINWERKSDNLKELAKRLSVGLDSFVLFDDNPAECAEVRAHAPEVAVVQLPPHSDWQQFLNHLWLFDERETLTSEDRNRLQLYQQNAMRESARHQTRSLAEFIAGLQLHVDIHPMRSDEIDRTSQLTLRTNQFHSRMERCTVPELQRALKNREVNIWTVAAQDRFGDYGLVGAIFFRIVSDHLFVENLLLSCRALGRGIESAMIRSVGKFAIEQRLSAVRIAYRRASRNLPIFLFLKKISGSECLQDAEEAEFVMPADAAANCGLTEVACQNTPQPVNTDLPSQTIPYESRVYEQVAVALSDPKSIVGAVGGHRLKSAIIKQAEFVAPRTPIEKMLAEIWEELLGVKPVGIHDDFFQLGGHSLLGTVMLSRIRKRFQVELPLMIIYEGATVLRIAEAIEADLIAGYQQHHGHEDFGDSRLAGAEEEQQVKARENGAPVAIAPTEQVRSLADGSEASTWV